MKIILLANLGNRNITYTGERKLTLQNSSFRADTKVLLENFETEKAFIVPQILPELLQSMPVVPSKIYLFGSNQEDPVKNTQDTIYEAEILSKIFREQYPQSEVKPVTISGSVVDVNGLMQFYRSFINILLEANPETKFILCDAGGTSHQKSALKIISEYLLSDDQYELYNVALINGKSVVERIESLEYRKVIDSQQIELLVNQYDYTGALSIYFGNRNTKTDSISALLHIGKAVFSNNADEVVRLANSVPKPLKVFDIVKRLAQQNFYKSAVEKWQSLLDKETVFRLCLILDIAQAHRTLEDWGFTLLYHHIFEERFLQEVLKAPAAPYSLEKRLDWEGIREKIAAGEKFPNFPQFSTQNIACTYSATVPVMRSLAISILEPAITEVVNLISDDAQKQFSGFRNKFAHEGRSIYLADLKSLTPIFEDWRTMFCLGKENVLDELNKLVVQQVRK